MRPGGGEELCRMSNKNSFAFYDRSVLDQVLQLWRSEARVASSHHEQDLDIERVREAQYILEILIAYSKKQPGDMDVLFDMIQAFVTPSVVDMAFLKKFLWEEVALKLPVASRKTIISKFLRLFGERAVDPQLTAAALRMLVIPVLLVAVSLPEFAGTLDEEVVADLAKSLWIPYLSETQAATLDDSMKIELLQITTLIVQYGVNVMGDYRKDVIKYVWNIRNAEDPTCKQSAYVALARFIEAFDTPAQIVIQAFVALLKSHQSESRVLVRQALDILVPVLPLRVGVDKASEPKFPVWVRWTRKIITEDTNNAQQVASIYQLMIRHASLFYEHRDQFIPLIIPSLPKLGLTTNTTNETRLLTIDLVDLVLSWERQRLEEALGVEDSDMAVDEDDAEPGSKRRAPADFDLPQAKRQNVGGSGATVAPATPADNPESLGPSSVSSAVATLASSQPSSISTTHRETTLAYCMRFLCTLTEPLSRRSIPFRIANLIRDLLRVWPDITFKLSTVEKVTAQDPSPNINIMIANILELLHTIIETKPADWFVANVASLQRCLEPVIRTEQPTLVKIVSRVVRVVWANLPSPEIGDETQRAEVSSFVHLVEGVIQNGLQNMTNSSSVVSLLHAAYDEKPDEIDKYVTSLNRLLQKLVKDHTPMLGGPPAPGSAAGGQQGTSGGQQQQAPAEPVVPIIISLLQLLKVRTSTMVPDNRRILLKEMINIMERSNDAELLRTVLHIVRDWVFATGESFPTIKEKATLVVKMMSFEGRGDRKLLEDYLSLVADIYSDAEFARTELTVKLEQAFLMGTRNENPALRNRFMTLFTNSISRNVSNQLRYILGVQNWESVADTFWIQQALVLLLGSVVRDRYISQISSSCRVTPNTNSMALLDQPAKPLANADQAQAVETIVAEHASFLDGLSQLQVDNLLLPLKELILADNETAHRMWVHFFPLVWNVLEARERHDMIKLMIALLSKDYHMKQVFQRPNVIQTLLDGLARCLPPVALAPQLVKYLSRTYNAWHTGIEILQGMASMESKNSFVGTKEEDKIRESTMDALADLYNSLSEGDYFCGLWRRRCLFNETNLAISYEQTGLWQHAQHFYEAAQNKGRVGVTPFVESEYYLWEEHWIKCTEKLQQWDLLSDLAHHEKMNDLLLECAWRLSDWQATSSDREGLSRTIGEFADNPTPRRKVFEAFLLLSSNEMSDKGKAFKDMCDQGMDLSLRQWYSLPRIISVSHVPLLHMFQQYVELSEASNIQANLSSTIAANIEVKSQELKGILQTWRERLPNKWEDINMWSDLVAWRQHVFTTINKAYVPLIPQLTQQGAANGGTPTSSYGYRGYHETAWIINRFANVARKHGLTDVCITSLSKIYTLPNIEIQEAFYKLREQARCYFQTPAEYPTGLDVINNTNLAYFIPAQKAEFFTLKADFLARLNLHQEANEAYASAVQIDPNTAKAWASWGEYNDRMFHEQPTEVKYAQHAINCHLHAAALYKNYKSRKFNARVLWLVSLDDGQGGLYKAFESYKGDVPIWFWITFVPQLLAALSNKETRHARALLKRIAKHHPQALHFHLRAAKEEYSVLRKQVANAQAAQAAQQQQQQQKEQQAAAAAAAAAASEVKPDVSTPQTATGAVPPTPIDGPKTAGVGDENGGPASAGPQSAAADGGEGGNADTNTPQSATVPAAPPAAAGGEGGAAAPTPAADSATQAANQRRQPWENVEEIMSALKTGHPLLALSMETMVDQIIQRLKPTADDDMYRLISALLNDAVQVCIALERSIVVLFFGRKTDLPFCLQNWMSKVIQNETWTLPKMMEANLSRLAEGMNHQSHIKYKGAFEQDFIKTKPNLLELIARFRDWRDKLEHLLDSRPRRQHLEQYSHYLIEFEHQKFAEIEVPGQYLLHKESAVDFITIDRFQPEVDVVRAHGSCLRRLTIRGHDGSLHPFLVQNPATRQGRREERIMQFFRILNTVLERKKESRRRNLSFHLPLIVPLSHQVRLVQDDPSYQSLSDIYEDHCDRTGIYKDEPMIYYTTTLREMLKAAPDEKGDPAGRKAVGILWCGCAAVAGFLDSHSHPRPTETGHDQYAGGNHRPHHEQNLPRHHADALHASPNGFLRGLLDHSQAVYAPDGGGYVHDLGHGNRPEVPAPFHYFHEDGQHLDDGNDAK